MIIVAGMSWEEEDLVKFQLMKEDQEQEQERTMIEGSNISFINVLNEIVGIEDDGVHLLRGWI